MNNEQRQDWPRPAQDVDEAHALLTHALGSDAVNAIRELAEAVVADALAQEAQPDNVFGSIREENSRLRSDFVKMEKRVLYLKDELLEGENEIALLEAGNSILAQQVEDLEKKLEGRMKELTRQDIEAVKLSLENSDLAQQVEDLEKKLEWRIAENDVLRERNRSLAQKAEYDRRLIDRLKNPANWRVSFTEREVIDALSMVMTGRLIQQVDTPELARRLSERVQVEYDPSGDN